MQFNSYSYILLLIPAIALFWALPPVLRRWHVLAVSIAYYATWSVPVLAVPLVLCAGVQFATTMVIRRPSQMRRWFRAGVAWVLVIFLVFRYREIVQGVLAQISAGPAA